MSKTITRRQLQLGQFFFKLSALQLLAFFLSRTRSVPCCVRYYASPLYSANFVVILSWNSLHLHRSDSVLITVRSSSLVGRIPSAPKNTSTGPLKNIGVTEGSLIKYLCCSSWRTTGINRWTRYSSGCRRPRRPTSGYSPPSTPSTPRPTTSGPETSTTLNQSQKTHLGLAS